MLLVNIATYTVIIFIGVVIGALLASISNENENKDE